MTSTETTCAIADSVGTLLRTSREQTNLSHSDIAKRINVPEWFLTAIEDGRYDEIPEDIYSRIYLKAYCTWLHLDVSKIHGMYRAERTKIKQSLRHSLSGTKKHPHRSIPTYRMIIAPKLIKSILLGTLIVGLGLYFIFALKKIVIPPTISLISPRDGFVTTERTITVSGKTDPEIRLLINGKQIPTDNDGNFQDSLTLHEGLNTINVIGSKKYSKNMIVTRRIIVEPKERPTASAGQPIEVSF